LASELLQDDCIHGAKEFMQANDIIIPAKIATAISSIANVLIL
jgi:hypothetical protein